MTVKEIENAIHEFDLVNRPCIIFLHPDDAEKLKMVLPDIEKEIVIQSTPYVEKGKGYLMERKDLELWKSGGDQMTREERENALHCLKVMIGEEVCEECNLYGTTGTDHCEKDCVRLAIKELEQEPKAEWIPVKFRSLTKEEQEKYPDYCYMADCLMPDEGDEILVTTTHDTVEKDEAGFDDGFYLDSGYDWQTDIVAWMPLPEPYKESEVRE